MEKKSYCTQNAGDCPTCSLVNYRRGKGKVGANKRRTTGDRRNPYRRWKGKKQRGSNDY